MSKTPTYRIYEGQLVELQQVGQPTQNTFFQTGLNLNKAKAYIKGQGFAKWVNVSDLDYPYSNFYWAGN
jgi:hypothetical protein